jgi:hypothetical protein
MKTVWPVVYIQRVIHPIEIQFPLCNHVCNSTYNGTNKGHIPFMLKHKPRKKDILLISNLRVRERNNFGRRVKIVF